MFRIIGPFENKAVQGVCQFDYKGYEISLSSRHRHKSIAVYDRERTLAMDQHCTVQEAIEFVDKLGEK